MIAQSKVEALIRTGEIAISYWFQYPSSQPNEEARIEEVFVNISDDQNRATEKFRQNFFGDRLLVTLGPIVMSHDRRYFNKRPAYKGKAGYFDLRTAGNELIIEPYETLSVSTNERIRLGPKIGAYILPRLRNVDSGIIYVPSYIDPYWDGILQAVIINATGHHQRLSLYEGLAICRFYFIDGDISESVKEAFPSKSHHFGQSWPKILLEDAEPFPRRKLPRPSSSPLATSIDRVKSLAREYWKLLVALGIGGSVITSAYNFGQLRTNLKDIPTVVSKVDNLTSRFPVSGTTTIPLPVGQTRIVHTFQVARSQTVNTTVWVGALTRKEEVKELNGRVEAVAEDANKIKVIIEIVLQRPSDGSDIQVEWLLTS